jgi:WD40 repeat protein/energy-coupling factor transporter ATP-binding protein EcfA2
MARRKAGDKKGTVKKNRAAGEEGNNVQADNYSIAFKEIQVGGNVGDIRIGHTIGYTAEQVSVLLKQITTTLQPKKFDGRCPYKGLEVFEEEDAELFFGRERLVHELVGRVKESRTVFITGPSGSGKSSLVRAGLIHALKQGAIKSSDHWLYETMKPGREPLKDLALAFSRLKSPELEDYFLTRSAETDILNKCAESVLSGRKDQRFLLFVDQFEEIFTQINSEEERIAFINMLAHAGTVENGRVIVLFAMRSDFVSNCATYPALNELLSQEFRQIGAMQPEELVSAIALPARHVGLPVEHELIAQIINDMKGEPDALPLMQFALKDLFDAKQAEGGVIALTLKDYLGHGGIHKSLERHADATFAKLSESEQELTRSIFSGLIEIGRGTQDTKRTALFDELIPANIKAEDVLAIVQKLADARLIITDEQAGKDTVTISHEKLIEAWPWLKKLVNENRDVIALQNEIASDAKEWEDHNRDESYLYSGARLANAREQLSAKRILLSDLSQIFVDTSQDAEEVEQRQEEQRRQKELDDAHRLAELEAKRAEIEKKRAEEQTRAATNLRRRSIYLTGALVAALIAVGVAVFFSVQSQKQATIARARELASYAVIQRNKDFRISLLLGIEAYKLFDLPSTLGALLDNTRFQPKLIQFFHERTDSVYSLAFDPTGKILTSGSLDGNIVLWDVETRQPIKIISSGHSDGVTSVKFSPNGELLVSSGYDGSIRLWDVNTQKMLWNSTNIGASRVVFSPDGESLAAGTSSSTIIFFDVRTHTQTGSTLVGHSDSVTDVAFSSDGTLLASGANDNRIILWDVATQQPISKLSMEEVPVSLAFSPTNKVLAVGAWNGITLWDLQTNEIIGQPLIGHTGIVSSLVFSHHGTRLISGSYDGSIIMWDVEKEQQIGASLIGHELSVESITLSPNGNTLASGGTEGTIILWNMDANDPIEEIWAEQNNLIYDMEFTNDGQALNALACVTLSENFNCSKLQVISWDVKSQRIRKELLTIGNTRVDTSYYLVNSNVLVSSTCVQGPCTQSKLTLLDLGSEQPIGKSLILPGGRIQTLTLSPDNQILAYSNCISWNQNKACTQYEITLFNLSTSKEIGKLQVIEGEQNYLKSLDFAADGKILISTSVRELFPFGSVNILWDIKKLQPVGQPIGSTIGEVVALHPEGDLLAFSNGGDGSVTLWDIESKQSIGEPIKINAALESAPVIAFSPSGETLAWSAFNAGIRLLNLNPRVWIEKSCERAGRNFTRAEWEQYFPNEEYRKTCEQWPLEPEVTTTPSPTP